MHRSPDDQRVLQKHGHGEQELPSLSMEITLKILLKNAKIKLTPVMPHKPTPTAKEAYRQAPRTAD